MLEGKTEKKPSFAFNHFNIQPFAFKTPRFQTPKNAFTQTSYTKDLRGLGSPPSSGAASSRVTSISRATLPPTGCAALSACLSAD
jgi:hypothetical protein